MRFILVAVLYFLLAALTACTVPMTESDSADPPPDELAALDLAAADVAMPDLVVLDMAAPDLASAPDLTTIADLAMPDLARPDLATPDLTSLPDMAVAVTVHAGAFNLTWTYNPQVVTIKAGHAVEWIFDVDNLNVMSGASRKADGKFCSPDDMNCLNPKPKLSKAGDRYTHRFTTPGAYTYFMTNQTLDSAPGYVVVK